MNKNHSSSKQAVILAVCAKLKTIVQSLDNIKVEI